MATKKQPAQTTAPSKAPAKALSPAASIRRAEGGFVLYADGDDFGRREDTTVVTSTEALLDAIKAWATTPVAKKR